MVRSWGKGDAAWDEEPPKLSGENGTLENNTLVRRRGKRKAIGMAVGFLVATPERFTKQTARRSPKENYYLGEKKTVTTKTGVRRGSSVVCRGGVHPCKGEMSVLREESERNE